MIDADVEVEFRDQTRWVPAYVADQLVGVETFTLTYIEAMDLINRRQFAQVANEGQQKLIDMHFRRENGGR